MFAFTFFIPKYLWECIVQKIIQNVPKFTFLLLEFIQNYMLEYFLIAFISKATWELFLELHDTSQKFGHFLFQSEQMCVVSVVEYKSPILLLSSSCW